nr:hypothetical protein [Streptomyces lunaelactis]
MAAPPHRPIGPSDEGELGADQALTFLREADAINNRRRERMVDLAREQLDGNLIARRRESPCRLRSDTLPSTPYRDSSARRRGGIPDPSRARMSMSAISSARSRAHFI